ncbi:MAG: triose-phosphate isomerase [Actinomycetia bacterium]|nr:triose-phosphate isomerase [Actinomycetes bacterium]
MSKRTPLIVANWKMNKTTVEAVLLMQDILNRLNPGEMDSHEVVVCPPFIDLKQVATVIEYDRSEVRLGAQDVHWRPDGAYTGAISVRMLAAVGCRFCIVGHSERRQMFREGDQEVAWKLEALLDGGIAPILCVGEPAEVRERGRRAAEDFVLQQVKAALSTVDTALAAKLAVAYEPIWSIGTGAAATPEDAQRMAAAIRDCLRQLFGDVAERLRILYGGSLNVGNVAMFAPQPDLDGGLIGGASLDAQAFSQMVQLWRDQ